MLRLRVASAIVLIGILLAALLWLTLVGWAGLVLVVIGIAAWEWGGFARLASMVRSLFVVVVLAICGISLWWCGLFDQGALQWEKLRWFYVIAALFWFSAAPVWLLKLPPHPSRMLIAALGLVAMIPVSLALVDLRALGAEVLIGVMAVVWVADIVAYFTGRRFGRHKLAPAVSPGKTVEGALGAIVGVAIYATTVSLFHPIVRASLVVVLGAALILAVMSIVGDLFESALKRQAGLKDSGNVLPGHGGMLDRIDALLPVLPLAALVLPR